MLIKDLEREREFENVCMSVKDLERYEQRLREREETRRKVKKERKMIMIIF